MKKISLSILFTLALSLSVLSNAYASETEETEFKESTIKQGEAEVQEYLKSVHKHYNINSQEYIKFLQGINEESDEITENGYDFELMEIYSTTYLEEIEKYVQEQEKEKEPQEEINTEEFELPKQVENATVEEVQEENIEENQEIEKEVKQEKEKSEESTVEFMSQTYPSVFTAVPLSSGYNRSAAKKYMSNNWNRKDSYFGYYGENNGGGDCTNYASQVVLAGGMTMNTKDFSFSRGYHRTTRGWYNQSVPKAMGARTYSTSWTTVSDFYGYWAGTKKHKVYNLTSPKQVSKYVSTGDVIQMYSKSSKKWVHTGVIYDVYKGYPRYSAHSSAHLYAHLERDWKPKYYKYRVIKF
ncbi:amidase domain-containing protein [Bacillus paralicheniformis]|uniref:amidase domain-containing protein n=1 Tax=Bacillus paralicheniformis TaxID=1648923 RepID=UPI00128B2C78|nr:amidase domain-containing protein [Bacillus paralicheniformis]MPQ27343.1 hypothetical protein [Bacillus paralicheniformis]